jgi:hypothetical protein
MDPRRDVDLYLARARECNVIIAHMPIMLDEAQLA